MSLRSSLRHDEEGQYSNHLAEAKAEGFELDVDDQLRGGEQFEMSLFYAEAERRKLLSHKLNPTEVLRESPTAAVIHAIIENKRQTGTPSVQWIDDVEIRLHRLLDHKKLPITQQRQLMEIIPCVDSSLDLHYGTDAFVLAWQSEYADRAQKFSEIIDIAKGTQKLIDRLTLEKKHQEAESEKSALRDIYAIAEDFLGEAVKRKQCALATIDATLNPEKEAGTADDHSGTASTKADLLVTLRGGILHRDFSTDLIQRSDHGFSERSFEIIKRESRHIFIARALKLILEWKWEQCNSLLANLREPRRAAAWVKEKTDAYHDRYEEIVYRRRR